MRARLWRRTGVVAGVMLALLVLGGFQWWRYVNYVPPVQIPTPAPLPTPNARNDFLAALALLPVPASVYEPRTLDTPALRKLVRSSRPALRRLRKGLRLPYAAMPNAPSGNDEIMSRSLYVEAELARREGRYDAALQAGLDMVRMGRMIQCGGAFRQFLAGVNVQHRGLQCVDGVVDLVGAEAAERGARELVALAQASSSYADVLTASRALYTQDVVRACRINDPHGAVALFSPQFSDGSGPPSTDELRQAMQFFVTPRRQIVADYLRFMKTETTRARRPYFQRTAPTAIPSEPLNRLYLEIFQDTDLWWDHNEALRRIFASRLAARAYTLRDGGPPASLAALVPRYLPSIPQDPFAPAPLIYWVNHGKPLVYSRGPDGDDDAGRNLSKMLQRGDDGDVVNPR